MIDGGGVAGATPVFHNANGAKVAFKCLPIDVFSQNVSRIIGAHDFVERKLFES